MTKRQLGMVFILAGMAGALGVLAYDVLRHHALGGAYQVGAFGGCALLIGLGLTLIPLGAQPL